MQSAKTTRPTPRDVLPRARLFRLLDRARRPVAWVVGPPGSGKTVLAVDYLRARRLRFIWYRVDESDADVATPFLELRRTFGRRSATCRSPLPRFRQEHLQGLGVFARRYFQQIYARMRAPFVLVLDDYHQVPPGSPFHDVVRCALDELPPGGSAIVLSRADPPPQFVRFRASHAIRFVEWRDLRLTPAETRGLARLRSPTRLSPQTLRELHEMTDGWAAGLILQLERASRGSAADATRGSRVSEEIFDYFAGEIFATEPASTQTFLLRTAFLGPMTVALATRLTRSPHAAEILTGLVRRNYFTDRSSAAEPTYQYHPLFREFLAARARTVLPSARLADLQRRTARLLVESGRDAEAADLLREAGDWSALADLIIDRAPTIVAQGRMKTLDTWLSCVPQKEAEGRAWLLYWRGVCRLPLDPVASRSLLERAFQLFDRTADGRGLVAAWCGTVEAILYAWSDFTRLDSWIARIGTIWETARTLQDPLVEARVAFGIFGSLMFRQPQHPEIGAWAERAFALAGRTGDISQRVVACSHLTHYFFWIGDLDRARRIIDSINRATRLRDATPLTRLNWTLTEAIACWHQSDSDGCVARVSEGLEEARATGVHLWDTALAAQGVYGTLSAGRLAEGRAYLRQIVSTLDATRQLDVSHYHYLTAWEAALRGDTAAARRHAALALELSEDLGSLFPEGLGHLALADAAWDEGDREKACQALERGRTIALQMRSAMLQFMALLLEARFAFARDDEIDGRRSLQRAMQIGRRQRIVNTPWWRPSQMAALCVRALAAGIEVEYVRALVRRHNLVPAVPPLEIGAWPWPVRVFTLQPFRVERDGQPAWTGRKVPHKPLTLLKLLVAFGGRVGEGKIVDTLWPDADGDAAHRALAITLHRARQLIGLDGAIRYQGGRLSLDPRVCWVDAWAFEYLARQAQATARVGHTEEARRLAARAAALYCHPFLADQPNDARWAGPQRESLQGKYVRVLAQLGRQEPSGSRFLTQRGR